jgi:VIT1/CCC1 family predicted Fe2+/Mn2+ transporter
VRSGMRMLIIGGGAGGIGYLIGTVFGSVFGV